MNDKTRIALADIASEHRNGLILQLRAVNQRLDSLKDEQVKLEVQVKQLQADIERVNRALANTMLP